MKKIMKRRKMKIEDEEDEADEYKEEVTQCKIWQKKSRKKIEIYKYKCLTVLPPAETS